MESLPVILKKEVEKRLFYLADEKGDYPKVVKYLERLSSTDETNVQVQNALAWMLATCFDEKIRNGPRAVELARSVVERDFSVEYIDTLAAAYAEAGNFAKAIETQEKAISLLEEGSRYRDNLEKRLAAYRKGEAWREDGCPYEKPGG